MIAVQGIKDSFIATVLDVNKSNYILQNCGVNLGVLTEDK